MPDKYFLKNKLCLKLYLFNSKNNIITKSGFLLYMSQIILFFISFIIYIFNVLKLINLSNNDILLILKIMIIYIVLCYFISFSFNSIINIIYKNRKNLKKK